MNTRRMNAIRLLPCLAALWIAPIASAQHTASVPSPEVTAARDGVAAMGRRWDAAVMAETTRLYLVLQRQRSDAGIRRIRDQRYGPAAGQTLDLFVPGQGFDELGPVFVFLHDSDAATRDKIVPGTDELLYSNVAKFVARVGGVGINANYPPRTRNSASARAEDIRRLIAWARRNVAQHGGDPQSIIVLGHGEGALRLANYLFHQPSQPADGPGIAGAILGGTKLDTPALNKLVDAYRGKTVPLMLWNAEYDPLESGVAALKDKLCATSGACPMLAELKGHNHGSAVMSFDTADTAATNTLIRFYHSAVHK